MRNHATRNSQRSLVDGNRGQIGGGQFVRKAVAVRVDVTKPLLGLHAVMMVEGVIAELPQGDDVARLVSRDSGPPSLPPLKYPRYRPLCVSECRRKRLSTSMACLRL